MIIKKKNFNLTPGFRGKWPFTVPEVTVMGIIVKPNKDSYSQLPLQCFVLIHNWVGYALSGLMENYGYAKFEDSGIWAVVMTPITTTGNVSQPVRKSLTSFFEYLEGKVKG